MARIFHAAEPARTTLPDGWEWRSYGAQHIASGRCVSWSHNGARFVGDSTPGTYRTREAAMASVEKRA